MANHGLGLVLGVVLAHVLGVIGNDCNWQYYKHYEQKGCKPVLGEDGCPVKFQCEELSEEDLRTCVHKGKTYKHREEIHDLGPCDSCKCVDNDGSARIECAEVDCPDWEPRNKSCYMGYKTNTCCREEICPNEKEKSTTCNYNGREYRLGDYIQTSKPCRNCICTKEWTNENGPGCSEADCLTGIYAHNIRSGCLPIHTKRGCCFIAMHCGSIHGATPVNPPDEDRDNYCQYRGLFYKKGSTAFLENNKQVQCTCSTPPDFTCLRI